MGGLPGLDAGSDPRGTGKVQRILPERWRGPRAARRRRDALHASLRGRVTLCHARPAPFRGGRRVRKLLLGATLLCLAACQQAPAPTVASAPATAPVASAAPNWFDNSGRDDVISGGVRMIPIHTPKGDFRVWTKRVGNHPTIKVLLLHGGPGVTHEVFEAFDSYFPGAGIEYYYYDQLGSAFSDQPKEPSLWEIDRFVDEVEQVRQALQLGPDNFYLYGQSWGGLLGIEYALKHQDKLKGLVVSNMMSSIPAYNEYARNVLMPAMDPAALEEILALEAKKDYANPRYEALLMQHFYTRHVLRLPPEQWPQGVVRGISAINKDIYIPMQGPSEMGASGKLAHWDRSRDLKDIKVPTLVIGAAHDTMDPKHMEWMSNQFPRARYLFCPNGSHMAEYDDQQTYMTGLITFLKDVDAGRF
jgi:proline iminopeptidase